MAKERIFIVEDEGIVAADLQTMLKRMGYEVLGTAASGAEALQAIERLKPDLVLMDIRIQGDMDGVQTAEHVMIEHEIPVTYLTAYADETTLERAKITLPYGYILKPFEERDLRTTIELALYKHRMQQMMHKIEGWHAATLQSLGEAVIATNVQGRVTYMNHVAESMTGWKTEEAYAKKLAEVFNVLKSASRQAVDDWTTPAQNISRSAEPMVLIARDKKEIPISFSRGPLKDDQGVAEGSAIVFHRLAM